MEKDTGRVHRLKYQRGAAMMRVTRLTWQKWRTRERRVGAWRKAWKEGRARACLEVLVEGEAKWLNKGPLGVWPVDYLELGIKERRWILSTLDEAPKKLAARRTWADEHLGEGLVKAAEYWIRSPLIGGVERKLWLGLLGSLGEERVVGAWQKWRGSLRQNAEAWVGREREVGRLALSHTNRRVKAEGVLWLSEFKRLKADLNKSQKS